MRSYFFVNDRNHLILPLLLEQINHEFGVVSDIHKIRARHKAEFLSHQTGALQKTIRPDTEIVLKGDTDRLLESTRRSNDKWESNENEKKVLSLA